MQVHLFLFICCFCCFLGKEGNSVQVVSSNGASGYDRRSQEFFRVGGSRLLCELSQPWRAGGEVRRLLENCSLVDE